MNDAWGGYANGAIPSSAMKAVQGFFFKPDAAETIAAAIAECAKYGVHVAINEGYRPLGKPGDDKVPQNHPERTSTGGSNQWFQYGRMKRGETPSASYPGGSIHGWGRAADVSNGANPKVREIFRKHGWVFDIASESWHAHFVGGSPSPAPAPSNTDQATVQQAMKAKGLYAGAIDGVFGPQSWKAVQTFLKQQGLYGGAIDGVPGSLTYKGFQTYAKKGGYNGPIDGVLGALSWAGFAKAVKPSTPVATPTPATPAPVAPVTPIKPTEPVQPVSVPEPAQPEPTVAEAAQPAPATPEIVTPEPIPAPETPAPAPEPAKPEEKPVPVVDTAEQEKEIASLPATDLGAIIPSAKGRKIAYSVYMAASLAITNTAIGFAALHAEFPAWLIVSIAVVGNLATPFGALAIANASPKK
jgi:peptidoglycan hydrolase-like protein with peptidoglycan-binding domain